METRREFAARMGLAIPGARGRLSKKAHEAILEAEKNGTVFSDSPNRGKSVQEIADSEGKDKPKSISESFGNDPTPIFNGGWYREDLNGRRVDVSGKSACGECRYSLDYQACKNPTVVNEIGNLVPVSRVIGG